VNLTTVAVPYGVDSMTAPLAEVLVQSPHPGFGAAFGDPSHGFLRPVDFPQARIEHQKLRTLLTGLGVNVHELGGDDHPSPDLVYAYDPAFVTPRGAILLRSGKPNRQGEERVMGNWFRAHGIPMIGEISPPGTVDGGDIFWLRPGLVCVGRSLRTNQHGIDQLTSLFDEEVAVFDVPYDRGPEQCLHLLSVISPVADDLAVVELERLPAGLFGLLTDLEVTLVDVPASELATLGCNVLAVAPRVAVMVAGNPETERRLTGMGVEVHTFAGEEICRNGGGGPTCLTRPIHRRP
jgi:N-dimethylarginine dimethylaminohydrolase